MKVRRRHHLYLPGVGYIGMTVMMGLGAVNSQNNLLFLAFGLALASILIAGVVSGWSLMSVEVTRVPLFAGRVGEPMTIAYQLRNRSRWMPAFGLVIEEAIGGHDSTWRQFFPRIRTTLDHLPARRDRHIIATVEPTARGVAQFDQVRVWTTFPFGVFKKSITMSQPAEALLRPARVNIAPQALDQVMAGAGATERTSSRIGLDAEFYGLRDYTPGDSMRRIAWRATARTGELVVKESFAAVSADVTIAISFARSDGPDAVAPDEQDELAISVAASLIEAAIHRGARVVVVVPIADLRVECRSSVGSVGPADEALDALARLDLSELTDLRASRRIDQAAESLLVIHSHAVDPSIAPTGATHMTARRAVTSGRLATASPKKFPVEVTR